MGTKGSKRSTRKKDQPHHTEEEIQPQQERKDEKASSLKPQQPKSLATTWKKVTGKPNPDLHYPMAREGPHEAHFKQLDNGNEIPLGDTLRGNGGNNVFVSDVKLRGNCWYYEITITSLSYPIYVGWISDLFTGWGTSNGWFVGSDQKAYIAGSSRAYGSSAWAQGDVIGCALNLKLGMIYLTRNGQPLAVKQAFDLVKRGDEVGEHFMAAVCTQYYSTCTYNFGDQGFKYPMQGYYPVHSNLGTADREELKKLFKVYQEMNDHDEDDEEEGDEPVMSIDGTLAFSKELGIDIQRDISMVVIAWKLNAVVPWEFSDEEWELGWSSQGCKSLDEMKVALKKWEQILETDDSEYEQFYYFAFQYMKDGKKVISVEESIMVWDLIFKRRNWALYADWIEFIVENAKGINTDTWDMLWKFSTKFPKNFDEYDEADCWPFKFDDFVEWFKEKH